MRRRPHPLTAAAAAGLLLALSSCADNAPATVTGAPAPQSGPPAPAVSSSAPPSAAAPPSPTGVGTLDPSRVQTIPPAPGATTARGRGDAPDPAEVNRRSWRDVGESFVQLAYTSDTRVDRTPSDAARRAAPLATVKLARALRGAAPAAAPGAQWQRWTAQQAYTTVSLTENVDDGRPPDTPAELVRSWSATISPVADDGWTGTPQELTLYVALSNTRHDGTGTWSVSDLRAGQ